MLKRDIFEESFRGELGGKCGGFAESFQVSPSSYASFHRNVLQGVIQPYTNVSSQSLNFFFYLLNVYNFYEFAPHLKFQFCHKFYKLRLNSIFVLILSIEILFFNQPVEFEYLSNCFLI